MSNLGAVGGRTFGTSVGEPHGRIKTEDELDAQAKLLQRIVKLGKEKGIVIYLHNHNSEVINGMYDFGGTIKRIRDIQLGLDLNWLLRAGMNPVELLKKHKEQICFLHLRDQSADGQRLWVKAMWILQRVPETYCRLSFD